MLSKLRNQFIIINMTCVGIILLVVFCIIGVSTFERLEKDSQMALEKAFMHDEKGNMPAWEIGGPKLEEKDNFRLNLATFVVRVNADRTVGDLFGQNVTISEETLEQIVSKCLDNGNEKGYIRDSKLNVSLKYLIREFQGNTEIAFYDMSQDYNMLFHLIKNFALAGLFSMLIFFIISRQLAKWILRPVEESWERQKQFVADASHELKTPLTVILANTEILNSHSQDTIKEHSKWLEYIKEEAEHMKGLVNDLLFLAKSDAAREKVVFSEVNISDILWNVYLPFESVAFEQGKSLNAEIASDIYIKSDAGKLKQLMMILLDNACKYTLDNGKIYVNLYKHQEKIVLSVNNSGEPIPKEYLPHLFERFFRAEESRARQQGGYGLGLSIAKTITDMLHGKISVVSNEKEGTTFTVTFNLNKDLSRSKKKEARR